jgi:Yip1 domain
MNDQMNAPVPREPTGVAGWFSIWTDAVTKPNEQTYAALAEHPDAMSNNRAFLWVFLAGTISALITGILQAILQLAGVTPQIPGLAELTGGSQPSTAASFGIAICTAPIAGALAALFFAIFVGIVQWVAKLFGGTGTFSQLAYTTAAISVPFTLISSVLSPFSTVNVVGYCVGGISLLLGLYALALQVMAVKAVNRFGWGPALGSYFLPLLLILCLCVCVIFGLVSMMGPAMEDIFNQIIPTP